MASRQRLWPRRALGYLQKNPWSMLITGGSNSPHSPCCGQGLISYLPLQETAHRSFCYNRLSSILDVRNVQSQNKLLGMPLSSSAQSQFTNHGREFDGEVISLGQIPLGTDPDFLISSQSWLSHANKNLPLHHNLQRLEEGFSNDTILFARRQLPPLSHAVLSRGIHQKPQSGFVSLDEHSELKAGKAAYSLEEKVQHVPEQSTSSDSEQLQKAKREVESHNHVSATLDLSDYEQLYAKLASNELASTLINLQLVSNDILVAVGTWILNSPIMKIPVFSAPVYWVLQRTAYHHFCAGGTLDEAARTLERMWQLGLQGILDYSIEDALTSAACDRNLEAFLRTIHMKNALPAGSVSFACVKMTALCPLATLERASAVLRWHNVHPSLPRPPWMQPSLPILAPDSPPPPPGQARPEPLAEAEAAELAASLDRLHAVAQACREESLPLLVDAEYTSVQPAIDYLTFAVALEFNGEPGQPLVYGTIQAYLKDAKPRLEAALRGAEAEGVSLGIKLVRGAYITRETDRARALGVPSPTHGSIEETHACYDACAALIIERAARGGPQAPAAVLATHNLESGRAAVVKMREEGLDPHSPLLQFAQLKGMADGLSLGLVREGFRVSKYLPFGPVADVIPYLIRRAEENKGLLGNTLADRRRLRKELWRRLTSW